METKTGKLAYKERMPGVSSTGRGARPVYASTILANGHLYAVSRRNGTFVIEAKPEFKLVAQNNWVFDGPTLFAAPHMDIAAAHADGTHFDDDFG